MKTTVSIVLVTPEMALSWLAMRTEDQAKRFRRAVGMKYARAMREGRWKLVGDAIDIDSDGRPSNGQHRLWAVAETGIAREFIVACGIAPDAFPVRDRGYSRSVGQMFHRAGVSNPDAVAGAAAIVWLEENGKLSGGWSERADADVLLDVAHRHEGLEDSVSRAISAAAALRMSRAVAGWGYYKFWSIDESLTEQFFEGLKTGANMAEGDPALMFRNRLMSVHQTRARLHVRDVAVLLVRAWNHYYAGRKVRTLKASVRAPGEARGLFPPIAGLPVPK